ncbi:MAG: hypothetical protein AAGA38_08050 [Pseudomonadota bacterium]
MTEATYKSPFDEPERVRQALASLVASDVLVRSERLISFLTYIVEETLAGRADAILGKTIAQDVYGRDPASTDNAENLVRVDAGRLRRKLQEYYAGPGMDDPLKIVIDPGGYAPRFVAQVEPEVPEDTSGAQSRRWRTALVAGAGVLAVVAGTELFWTPQENNDLAASVAEQENSAREVQRQALAAKSAAAVRAYNLCDQGRGFLFPIVEVGSQQTADGLFAQAIETDPGLACGYAGRAHALATLARLAGPSAPGDAFRSQAAAMAERAVVLAPTDGWSQSAAAWSAYANSDFAEAKRLSILAVELSPRDGNVLDFRATIAGVLGNFEETLAATDPLLERDVGSFRVARRNIRAVALFHLGDYAASIASLEGAIRNGDPVSAATLTYLTVGHYRAGNLDRAQAYAQELSETWPDARPDIGLARLYSTPELAEQVLGPLSAAGWRPRKDDL